MNKNTAITKKQPWGPFFKQIWGPNVPWAWYITTTVIQMVTANVFMEIYTIQGRLMDGEIFDSSLTFRYIALTEIGRASCRERVFVHV